MNKLLAGMQQTPNARTQNGDLAHRTTWNSCLDLFGAIGALRTAQPTVVGKFRSAAAENLDIAVRVALWARDVRGGAGERESFKTILNYLADNKPEVVLQLIPMIPEVGRWDDLLCLANKNDAIKDAVVRQIAQGLYANDALCAKWMPRKGPVANWLRSSFGMSPKVYRKLLVSLTNVVETKMCAKQWDSIEFGKLPSLAAARYQKAFTRNAEAQYMAYAKKLETGEEKINAGAIFPHDVLQGALQGRDDIATAQWRALPNYMEGTDERVLAMVDVSESMSCGINKGSGGVSCMMVSTALGLYCAERNVGPFKDHFVTFTDRPTLVKSNPQLTLSQRYREALHHKGYSTNFDAAYQMILRTAIAHNVPAEDMPTMLLVLSDMQFNPSSWSYNQTANQRLAKQFADAGYTVPKMVYWNLNAAYGNTPITMHDKNCALVSGFSPTVLKSIFAAKEFDPCSVMLETVMNERYNWQ